MFNLIYFRWLLILPMIGISPLEISPASGLASINSEPNRPQASFVADWQSIFRRYRPRRPLTSQGGICAIAPGLVSEVKVWRERSPLTNLEWCGEPG